MEEMSPYIYSDYNLLQNLRKVNYLCDFLRDETGRHKNG